MALFGNKTVACAICGSEAKGGFFRGLFQKKIDDQYICKDCYGDVDLPKDVLKQMDVPAFRGYIAFREENRKLREQFQHTDEVSLGSGNPHFVFDMSNRFLCMDKDLKTTIFEGCSIKSFVIKEDNAPIFEGNAHGLHYYDTNVRANVMALAPLIDRQRREIQMFEEQLKRMPEASRKEAIRNKPQYNIPEPFRWFHVIIYMDHPYWEVCTADMLGPSFYDPPSIDRYLYQYKKDFATLEKLANTLMKLAFPDTTQEEEKTVATGTVDAIEEIKRYKELMDSGILTEEEFTAKKRQLLGL